MADMTMLTRDICELTEALRFLSRGSGTLKHSLVRLLGPLQTKDQNNLITNEEFSSPPISSSSDMSETY